MKRVALGLVAVVSSNAFASVNCALRGTGTTYTASGALVPGQSYRAEAFRSQLAGNYYQVQEKRFFNDGRQESFTYTYSYTYGLLNSSSLGERLLLNCITPGYCVGIEHGPVLSGDATVEFSSSLIRTTLHRHGWVTEENLVADPRCAHY